MSPYVEWTAGESNPIHTDFARVSRPIGPCQPVFIKRSVRELNPVLRPYHRRRAAETPTDLFDVVHISDPGSTRIRTQQRFPGVSLSRCLQALAVGPRDRQVTEGGSRTHKSSGSRPDRFASLRTRVVVAGQGVAFKWRVRVSHPAVQAYEARLSTGSPALMLSVAKGRFELPRHKWHDILSVACLPFHHLAMLFRVGRDGVEPPQSEDRWVTASLAHQCTPTLEVTQAGIEPAISTVRAWRPQPRATGPCVSSTGGSRTHKQSRRFELRRFASCVPRPADACLYHLGTLREWRTSSRTFEIHALQVLCVFHNESVPDGI